MTDEEMAEEYENAQDYCGLLDVLLEEQYNQDYGGLSCYISPYIEQAFLAGLKAGRPEWHRVVDGDLPKYDVLGDSVSITVLNQNGNKVFYNFLEKIWKLEASNKISKVTAWCEIPKYKEE